jgi:hypothetical protein
VLGDAYERTGENEENQAIAAYNKMIDIFDFNVLSIIAARITSWPLLVYGKILVNAR